MLLLNMLFYVAAVGTDPSVRTFIDCSRVLENLPPQSTRSTRRFRSRLLRQSNKPVQLSKRTYLMAKTLMDMAHAGKLRIFFIDNASDVDVGDGSLLEVKKSSQLAIEKSNMTSREMEFRRQEIARDENERTLRGKQEQLALLLKRIEDSLRSTELEPAARIGNTLVMVAEASALQDQSRILQGTETRFQQELRSDAVRLSNAQQNFLKLSGPASLELIFERAGILESYRRWEATIRAREAWKQQSLFYRLEIKFLRSLVGASLVALGVWYGGPVISDFLHDQNPHLFMTGADFRQSLEFELLPFAESYLSSVLKGFRGN